MDRANAIKLLVVWIVAPVVALLFAFVSIEMLKRTAPVSGDQGLTILAISGVVFGLAALIATSALLSSDNNGTKGVPGTATRTWHYLILGGLPVAIIAAGAWLYGSITQAPEATLGILLLIGVIGLLMAIAVTTVFFHGLSLSDRTEALGLPRGSVRAIIALMLILIFALTSMYLYSSVNVTDQEAGQDLASQLITTISTLVVAVSAFYFGANSVQSATESVVATRSSRSIRVVAPNPLPKLRRVDQAWEPKSIRVDTTSTPPGLHVIGRIIGDSRGSLVGDATGFTYTPAVPVGNVMLRFSLADDPSVVQDVLLEVDTFDPSSPGTETISTNTGGTGLQGPLFDRPLFGPEGGA